MGWCRICKVNCETVEGLDLHSQTREHQKMAMDMVVTIKQNVKKHKSYVSSTSVFSQIYLSETSLTLSVFLLYFVEFPVIIPHSKMKASPGMPVLRDVGISIESWWCLAI